MNGGGRLVALRALLAVTLLAGFYVLGAAAVAGLGWLAVWLWLTFPGQEDAIVGGLAAAGAALALLASVGHLLYSRPDPPAAGHPVDERTAPGLWRHTRELAEIVGTRPPDEIRLVGEVNAFVWEDTGPLGLRRGRRCLYVGAPLLAAWPVENVRAVLAHELGHYSGRHAGFLAIAYRGSVAMRRTIERVGPESPAGLLLSGYAVLYSLVALAALRHAELEADAAAARAAGPAALAGALRDLAPFDATWDLLVASYARWARTSGHEPGELLERFARSPRYARPVRSGPPDPFGTHPPIATRLAALDGLDDASPGGARDGPATELVAGPEVLAEALRGHDFHQVVEAAARREAKLDASRLRRAGELDDVLQLLADGEGAELVRRLGPASRWDDGRAAAGDPGEYIVAAVVADGGARWRHAWSEPLRLEPASLGRLVAEACADPAAVAPLRDMLARLGVVSRHTRLHLGALSGPGRLADELFELCYDPDGRRALDLTTFPAALAAAALTDLRLLGAVTVDEHGYVQATGDPTGEPFLDSLLARMGASGRRRVHAWLQELGADVTDAVVTRARLRGRYRQATSTHARNPLASPAAAAAARERVLAAVDGGDLEGPDAALGMLLWATERLTAVLGWHAVAARVVLGGLGARDPIALGVRTVAGLGISPRAPIQQP